MTNSAEVNTFAFSDEDEVNQTTVRITTTFSRSSVNTLTDFNKEEICNSNGKLEQLISDHIEEYIKKNTN